MARSPNCTGAPLYKGRVDVTISYPDADDAILETPIELPASEPETPQIAYTVSSEHCPTWTPYELPHTKSAAIFASTTANSYPRYVYYRLTQNGSSVATGSWYHSSPLDYTSQLPGFVGVQVGDVLGCSLWSNGVGVVTKHKALIVQPTRICAGMGWLSNVVVAVSAEAGKQLRLGPPTVKNVREATVCFWCAKPETALPQIALNASAGLEAILGVHKPHKTYGLGRIYLGDYATNHTGYTIYLNYDANVVFTRIAYTPLNLRVCSACEVM
jgi:hypothetical protein